MERPHYALSLPLMGIGNPPSHGTPTWPLLTSSLPLMGIGNGGAPGRAALDFPAHYPSWGSGTHWTRAPDGTGRGSLPLMGIGNRISRRVTASRCSHSLPLMGIGNSTRNSSTGESHATHYPSWGSGTGPPCRWRSCPGGLITPHGDRELHRDAGYCVHLRTSLPLMGIGNPASSSPR